MITQNKTNENKPCKVVVIGSRLMSGERQGQKITLFLNEEEAKGDALGYINLFGGVYIKEEDF